MCKKDDENSTLVHLSDGVFLGADSPIEYLESCLPKLHFYKVHARYLINIEHVQKWVKKVEDENYLLMTDDTMVPVSNPVRKDLMAKVRK